MGEFFFGLLMGVLLTLSTLSILSHFVETPAEKICRTHFNASYSVEEEDCVVKVK